MSPHPEYYYLNPPSVIIDDSDPTIHYNGSWYTANETEIMSTAFGPRMPYFNTLHVLQIFSGSFSYNFTGAGISVFATPVDDSTYTSQCFLDGNEVPFDANATKAQFGQSRPVCQAFGLPDNIVHTISVQVSVPPRQQQDQNGPLSGFALDYFLIQSPSGVSLWDNGNQDVLLSILDTEWIQTTTHPTLNFGLNFNEAAGQIADVSRGWNFDPENGFNTTTSGSQFNLTFLGTSIWWYGYFSFPPNRGPLKNPSATFSIDGGTSSNLSETKFISESQAFMFKTPVLPYARHLLTVICHGNNDTVPMTLQSLILRRATPAVSSSTIGPLPSTTMSQSPKSPFSSQRAKTGGIVGGIAGGLIFLLVVASGVCVLIRLAKRKQRSMRTRTNGAIVAPEPFPVSTGDTVGVIAPRKTQVDQQTLDNPFMQQELQAPPLTKWTRRRAISGIPEPMHNLSTASTQQPELPKPRINTSPVQSDDEARPANTNTVDGQPAVPISEASHPPAPYFPIPTILSAGQAEREEDSGLRMAFAPVLPPLYTTH